MKIGSLICGIGIGMMLVGLIWKLYDRRYTAESGVEITWDVQSRTVTAVYRQVYDVPEGFDATALYHLADSVEEQVHSPYQAWTAAGEIRKRIPD